MRSSNNNCKVSTACASHGGYGTCRSMQSALHDPSYRRTIGPANSSNTKIRDFFLNNICSRNYYRAAKTPVSIFIMQNC